MVAVPCSALPFLEPKTGENNHGQSSKTEMICILLLLLTTLLHCPGLGHFPEGWEGTGSSKRGAESLRLVPATSSRKRGIRASHSSKSTSETDYIEHFGSENVYHLRKCTNGRFSLSQNLLSKIFQGELIFKSPYQLQTIQGVCVENKILAP